MRLNKKLLANNNGFSLIETISAAAIFATVLGGVLYVQQMTWKKNEEDKIKADFQIFGLSLKTSLTKSCQSIFSGRNVNADLASINTTQRGMVPNNLTVGNDINRFRITRMRVELIPNQPIPTLASTVLTQRANFNVFATIQSTNGTLAPKNLTVSIPLFVAAPTGLILDCAPVGTKAAECLNNLYPLSSSCGNIAQEENNQILNATVPLNQICEGLGMYYIGRNFCNIFNPDNYYGYTSMKAQYESFPFP